MESPRRGRIPQVLNRWIVVERQAPLDAGVSGLERIHEAHVQVVPCGGAIHAAVGYLREAPEVIADPACNESANSLNAKLLLSWKCGAAPIKYTGIGVREIPVHHRVEWYGALGAGERVAVQLEFTPNA